MGRCAHGGTGGKQKAQALKGAIEKENNESKVEIRRDTSIIFISDIEANIEEDDVKHEIINNVRKNPWRVKSKSK